MPKTQNDPPAGNGRVGDTVLYWPPDAWELQSSSRSISCDDVRSFNPLFRPRPGVVTGVGLPNLAGHNLNLAVSLGFPPTDPPVSLSPFCGGTDWVTDGDNYRLLVLPPKSELPNSLLKHVDDYEVVVARAPNNQDVPSYQLICPHCYRRLYVAIREESVCSLTFTAGKLQEGKPSVTDSETCFNCDCDVDYELPDKAEYERYS